MADATMPGSPAPAHISESAAAEADAGAEREQAAIVMQRQWRAVRSQDTPAEATMGDAANGAERAQAAIVLQRQWRTVRSKERLGSQHDSSRIIKLQRYSTERIHAATVLQKHWRGVQDRRRVDGMQGAMDETEGERVAKALERRERRKSPRWLTMQKRRADALRAATEERMSERVPQELRSESADEGGELESSVQAPSVVYYWLKPKVPAKRRPWTTPWREYKPMVYTHSSVLAMPPWADPESVGDIRFNEVTDGIDRRSHTGRYELSADGYPMNPKGRTGIFGRGLLGRWGPNHAADPIVTRWKRGPDGKALRDANGDKILEVVLIKRRDCGSWALPGGMIEAGDTLTRTLKKEFGEEALNTLATSDEERARARDLLDAFFKNGRVVYRGEVDDPRNTDCSWMETTAVLYHDDSGAATQKFCLHAGDDAGDVSWVEVQPTLDLYAGHTAFLMTAFEIVTGHAPPAAEGGGHGSSQPRKKAVGKWKSLSKKPSPEGVDDSKTIFPGNAGLQHFDLKYFQSLSAPLKNLLMRCIQPSFVAGNSRDGCVMFEPGDFVKLKPFFSKVMARVHGCDEATLHAGVKSGRGGARSAVGFSNDDGHAYDLEACDAGPCLARTRLARNLSTFPLPTSMTKAQRLDLETAIVRGLDAMERSADSGAACPWAEGGTYYSLTPGHPREASETALANLERENLLFEDLSTDAFAVAAGLASDWPAGRGLWVSKDRSLSVWVGEEDHVKVVSSCRSRYLDTTHRACRRVLNALERALREVGVMAVTDRGSAGWARFPEIGYVASRPSNCGTGMSASVKLYLPRVLAAPSVLDDAAKRGAISWREHSPLRRWKGQVVIDAVQTMGVTEADIVANLFEVVTVVAAEEANIDRSAAAAGRAAQNLRKAVGGGRTPAKRRASRGRVADKPHGTQG